MINPRGTDLAAASPLGTTIKYASTTAKITFSGKSIPNSRMKTGRKMDFGIVINSCNAGAKSRSSRGVSPRMKPQIRPTGVTIRKATAHSISVTSMSDRNAGSPSSWHKVASTSDSGGRSSGSAHCRRAASSQARAAPATISSHQPRTIQASDTELARALPMGLGMKLVGVERVGLDLSQLRHLPSTGCHAQTILDPGFVDASVGRERREDLVIKRSRERIAFGIGEILEVTHRPIPLCLHVAERLIDDGERGAQLHRTLLHHLLRGDVDVGHRRRHAFADIHQRACAAGERFPQCEQRREYDRVDLMGAQCRDEGARSERNLLHGTSGLLGDPQRRHVGGGSFGADAYLLAREILHRLHR